jgi:threonine dehydrogenase-like Zn-dependent dehydrogenase
LDCLLEYSGDSYFLASLAEPMSCIIGAFHASYHTVNGVYHHEMGIREGGTMAILAGTGPMGLGAIDYAIHCSRRPGLLVVTDINEERLKRAAEIYTSEEAAKQGIKLVYVNTSKHEDAIAYIKSFNEGNGFDDVFVFAPVRQVVEQAGQLLGTDGCLNFFAGPSDPDFRAEFNFYNVHYASTHITGTSGGNTNDLREALELMSKSMINPAVMITHIGGLDAVIDTTLRLPEIPGGKKLIYTKISMPLTAISEFEEKGKLDPLFKKLYEIIRNNKGIWCDEAEKFLLHETVKI